MGKKIEVKTRFENGSITFKMPDDRLCKLSGATISDLMGLIKPDELIRQGAMDIFTRYWRGSVELVRGPNGEQLEQWNSEPRWKHTPYVSLSELCEIVGLLLNKNLSAFSSFSEGIDFRICKGYQDWNMSHQEGGFYNRDAHSRESTVVVSPEQWEAMKAGG